MHCGDTFVPFSKEAVEQAISDRFEQQAARYGDHVALKDGDHALTYAALNEAANRVARTVSALQGEHDEPVTLLFEHGIPAVVAILGVLKAGKTYVALDPSYPHARLRRILEDTQSRLIVTDSRNLPLAGELSQDTCRLVNTDRIDATVSGENLGLPISPDRLASVFFTSGSTGQPKGIGWSHRIVNSGTRTYTNQDRVHGGDRLTLLFSFAFGASASPMFTALLNGATLCLFSPREKGLAALADWLIEEKITVFHPPISLFRQFLDTLPDGQQFPDVRLVILGGDSLYVRDVERFWDHFSPDCILVHQIASHEAGIFARHPIRRETPLGRGLVPVGYAVEGKGILVLDEAGRRVGFNQAGQIAVRSRYLSSGYWREPELDRQVFLPDPDGGDERICLTGDLGRLRPDGCLEFLGRKDLQLKIRGHRVEIAEVRAAILEHTPCMDAFVTTHTDERGEKRLIAYFVPDSAYSPTVGELRDTLAQILPDYMIPSVFVFMDALPLTSHGKVDREALPAPDMTRPPLDNLFVAPRDALEIRLVGIWERTLGVHPVGVKDDFFELGGQSLLAVSLFSAIEKELGTRLPLATLFHAPTVEQLAAILRREGWSPDWSSLVALQPEGNKPPLYCVHPRGGQLFRYYYLVRHLELDRPVYGLQARGFGNNQRPLTRVEDMAAHYIQEIRAFQPEGPYYLCGFSFGGKVAFEMARQLSDQGQVVKLLAMIDTMLVGSLTREEMANRGVRGLVRAARISLADVIGAGISLLGELRRLPPREKLLYIRSLPAAWQRHFAERNQQAKNEPDPERESNWPPAKRVQRACQLASGRYVPQPLAGRITFYKAAQGEIQDPDSNWGRWATGGVEVIKVPGTHRSIMEEPDVRVLAEKLRDALEQAQD